MVLVATKPKKFPQELVEINIKLKKRMKTGLTRCQKYDSKSMAMFLLTYYIHTSNHKLSFEPKFKMQSFVFDLLALNLLSHLFGLLCSFRNLSLSQKSTGPAPAPCRPHVFIYISLHLFTLKVTAPPSHHPF